MLQEEFQKLAGIEVSQEEYSHIEAVYNATTLNKQQFVHYWKLMNNDRILQYKAHMRAKHYYDIICERCRRTPEKLIMDVFHGRQLAYLLKLDICEDISLARAKAVFENENSCAHHWAF